MALRDSTAGYGLVSRLLHWLMAVAIVGLFALGYWMVDLDYYSPYYTSAPNMHRSVGIIVAIALVARIAWRLGNTHPSIGNLSRFERVAARVAHAALYVMIAVVSVSGYLISSSGGAPIDVFGLFQVPSIVTEQGLSDQAGFIHKIIAYALMALAVVHTIAAMKHHVIDKKDTLTRMWSGAKS
ncbi:MAG: cytochrome b [Hyphomicrobium sp.]